LVKNNFRIVLLVLFLLAAFGNLKASGEASGKAPDKIVLQLKWRHQFQFAGYYAAVEKGFYRDAGLEVIIQEASENIEPALSVLKGDAQFGIAGTDLLLLRAKGDPVVALAAIYQHSPMVFLCMESSGIENIHQLSGRRVMLESHSAELMAYLHVEGINHKSFELLPHSFGVKELISGGVDVISAYLTDEPFNLYNAGIPYRTFSPQSSGIDFYGDVLYTTEDQLTNYPERVKAFVAASVKGWQYAMANYQEIVDLIYSRYSQRHSRDHLLFEAQKSRPLILADVIEVGYMNIGRWHHILDKYVELGMINDRSAVDLEKFVFRAEVRRESLIRQAIQLGEIFFALVALALVIRMIQSYMKLEELERNNRRINLKLERSRRKISMLLGNMPGMAYKCLFDESFSMLYVSRGAFKLTGYKPEELIHNRVLAFDKLIHEDDRKTVRKTVEEASGKKKSFSITYRILTADRKEKWVWDQGQFLGHGKNNTPVMEGFLTDVTDAKKLENDYQKAISELQDALSEIKVLRGIIPICSSCKQIRDDKGGWNQIEAYIKEHSDAEFSHGLCPDCARIMFPGLVIDQDRLS